MRRLLALAVLGLAMFLLVLLVRLPAAQLGRLLPPGLALETPEGTVWNGRAALLVNEVSVGRLAWRLRPSALFQFMLRFECQWSVPGGDLQGIFEADRSGTRLRDLQGEMPIEGIAIWLGAPGWAGRTEFELAEMSLGRDGRATGTGELRLLDLTGNFGGPLRLGDFRWRPESPGRADETGTWSGFVEDTGNGPLHLRSILEFDAGGRYRLAGDLAVSPVASDSEAARLDRLLQALGAPDAEGRYSFVIESR